MQEPVCEQQAWAFGQTKLSQVVWPIVVVVPAGQGAEPVMVQTAVAALQQAWVTQGLLVQVVLRPENVLPAPQAGLLVTEHAPVALLQHEPTQMPVAEQAEPSPT